MWSLLEICPKISQNCHFIGLNHSLLVIPVSKATPFISHSPMRWNLLHHSQTELVSIDQLNSNFFCHVQCHTCVYIYNILYSNYGVYIYIYVYTRIKCHVNSHWLKHVVQQLGVWKWRIPTTWPWDHRENESHNKSRLIRIIHPPDFFRNSTCPSLLKNTAHVGDDSPSLAVRSQPCWS